MIVKDGAQPTTLTPEQWLLLTAMQRQQRKGRERVSLGELRMACNMNRADAAAALAELQALGLAERQTKRVNGALVHYARAKGCGKVGWRP
jgi:DNA-binding MarR family transcriptional regulator